MTVRTTLNRQIAQIPQDVSKQRNDAGLSAGESLGAPLGRKPLLILYCFIVGHCMLLEQSSNVI